jgi:carbon monoxide dehydrogenase subunit G
MIGDRPGVGGGFIDRGGVESREMQSGLPVGVAAFVGREHERAKVADLVTDARVVTLTGTGGGGKTRLAVEVAGDVAPRFSDGPVGWTCKG